MEYMTNSTDAPSSVTYTIQRNGYQMLFTVRGDSGTTLLDAMETIEKKLKEKGYIPQEKRGFAPKTPFTPQPSPSGHKCPKCGSPMAMKKDGTGEYCSKLCWKNPMPTKLQDDSEFTAF